MNKCVYLHVSKDGPVTGLTHAIRLLADVWIFIKITNKMKLCKLIYYSLSAVHVSGDVFAHHQEHLTVFTASGNIHQCYDTSRQRH